VSRLGIVLAVLAILCAVAAPVEFATLGLPIMGDPSSAGRYFWYPLLLSLTGIFLGRRSRARIPEGTYGEGVSAAALVVSTFVLVAGVPILFLMSWVANM
jgi:hypothetical protein